MTAGIRIQARRISLDTWRYERKLIVIQSTSDSTEWLPVLSKA